MKLSHLSRFVVSLALLCMTCMQLALASYICQDSSNGLTSVQVQSIANQVMMEMTNCTGMDTAQPTLCHSHTHSPLSQLSLDHSSALDIPAFVEAEILRILDHVDVAQLFVSRSFNSRIIFAVVSPPIAIRHCCFRI